MKHPHLPKDVLALTEQWLVATALGLKHIPHEFIETSREVLLEKVYFGSGKTHYDPYAVKQESLSSGAARIYYRHPGETLTHIDKDREPSLWERILPYPWGFLKGLHSKQPTLSFAEPSSFQSEWESFFALLDEVESALSSSEISALHIQSRAATSPILMRFLRKKCVGIASDPLCDSLNRRKLNGGLAPSDLYEVWGTSACFLSLKLGFESETVSLTQLNTQIKQALHASDSLIRYRIPTLEDGVIEMGL